MNQFAKPGLAEEKLPPVSTADNGKVLGVNNGVWDKVAASGGSDLPEVTADDKDKYLHTNSSTGNLEWSAVSGGGGGSGGGVLVVDSELQMNPAPVFVLKKTAGEIMAALQGGSIAVVREDSSYDDVANYSYKLIANADNESGYSFELADGITKYVCSTSSDYPVMDSK